MLNKEKILEEDIKYKILEDNKLYAILYSYTDSLKLDHSIIIYEWRKYTVRYKSKYLQNLKDDIIVYFSKYKSWKIKDPWDDMLFWQYLRTLKYLKY